MLYFIQNLSQINFYIGMCTKLVERLLKTRKMATAMSNLDTIVMSVGGSLIVPDQIDTAFLTELKKFIEKETICFTSKFVKKKTHGECTWL